MNIHYNFIDRDKSDSVLLLHGFMSDMSSMQDVADRLTKDFNVLLVDLPGFGKTTLEEIDVSYLDVLDSIKKLIDELSLENLHVVGYSMGGRIAIGLMCMYPELFKSAVLESTTVGIESDSARFERMQIDIERAAEIMRDYEAFVDKWEEMSLFHSKTRLTEAQYLSQKKNRLSQDPLQVARSLVVYGTGCQPYYLDAFKELELPIQLIVGEDDEKFVSINKKMHDAHNHTYLNIVKGASHNVHLEQPEKFGTIMLEFLLWKRGLKND